MARYFMGASAPESRSLRELLSLADEEELRQWHDASLGYASSQGDPLLRETIATRYPGLTADNIVTFAGAQEAIFTAYQALLKPGDRVQVILPIFEPLSLVAQGIGARVNAVALQPTADGQWLLDIDRWRAAIDSRTALATINFPHNPSGKLISRKELQQIVEHCAGNRCWLFSDEVFRGLEYRADEQLPPVASLYEMGISLGVVSKPFGLGGVRVGWIAARDLSLVNRMVEIKHYLSICNGRTDELLAQLALRHADELLEGTRQLIAGNLRLLRAGMASIATIKWQQADAGCVAYPRLADGVAADDFAGQLLSHTGVMVIPGNCFMWGKSHFRIGFGRRDFPRAWRTFTAEFLHGRV